MFHWNHMVKKEEVDWEFSNKKNTLRTLIKKCLFNFRCLGFMTYEETIPLVSFCLKTRHLSKILSWKKKKKKEKTTQ